MNTDPNVTAQIDAQLSGKEPGLQEIARALQALMKEAVPEATPFINPWGVPSYDFHGHLAHFMVAKSHVSFGFARGTSLHDPNKLLEGTGKNLRHVKLRKMEDLRKAGLRELIAEAAKLNKAEPQQGMSPRRKINS